MLNLAKPDLPVRVLEVCTLPLRLLGEVLVAAQLQLVWALRGVPPCLEGVGDPAAGGVPFELVAMAPCPVPT